MTGPDAPGRNEELDWLLDLFFNACVAPESRLRRLELTRLRATVHAYVDRVKRDAAKPDVLITGDALRKFAAAPWARSAARDAPATEANQTDRDYNASYDVPEYQTRPVTEEAATPPPIPTPQLREILSTLRTVAYDQWALNGRKPLRSGMLSRTEVVLHWGQLMDALDRVTTADATPPPDPMP